MPPHPARKHQDAPRRMIGTKCTASTLEVPTQAAMELPPTESIFAIQRKLRPGGNLDEGEPSVARESFSTAPRRAPRLCRGATAIRVGETMINVTNAGAAAVVDASPSTGLGTVERHTAADLRAGVLRREVQCARPGKGVILRWTRWVLRAARGRGDRVPSRGIRTNRANRVKQSSSPTSLPSGERPPRRGRARKPRQGVERPPQAASRSENKPAPEAAVAAAGPSVEARTRCHRRRERQNSRA